MSSIFKAILTGTLGLLVKKGRQTLAEKLKDGDATEQQLRSWIIEEFDNVNSNWTLWRGAILERVFLSSRKGWCS